jgi:hypothetical protein
MAGDGRALGAIGSLGASGPSDACGARGARRAEGARGSSGADAAVEGRFDAQAGSAFPEADAAASDDVLRQHVSRPALPPIRARNVWGHLRTITRHKILVGKYCFSVGLYRQGLAHDLSKYAPSEFWRGVRYYQGNRSPNAAERAHTGMTEAWLHHKGRNRHHFEYWIDIRGNGDATLIGEPMPTRYVVEMLCDRIAACHVYQGDAYTCESPIKYYRLESSVSPLTIHPATEALLVRMLEEVARQGEKRALAWVRDAIVRPRLVYVDGGRF